METEFKRDPVRFFRSMIMPLLPREAKLSLEQEGAVSWRSLLGGSDATREEGGNLKPESEGIGPVEEAGRPCVAEAMQGKDAPALPSGEVGPAAETHGTEGTV
jgi:hypothetical protein